MHHNYTHTLGYNNFIHTYTADTASLSIIFYHIIYSYAMHHNYIPRYNNHICSYTADVRGQCVMVKHHACIPGQHRELTLR